MRTCRRKCVLDIGSRCRRCHQSFLSACVGSLRIAREKTCVGVTMERSRRAQVRGSSEDLFLRAIIVLLLRPPPLTPPHKGEGDRPCARQGTAQPPPPSVFSQASPQAFASSRT